ncbi:MAG: hypothetical protein WCO63_00140 [Bacteroidota bacterium]
MPKKISLYVALILGILITVYRLNTVSEKETSWDVLGYYLYLPATFVHHDPLLHDVSWLKKLNEEKQLTGTLYQLSSNNKGEPMYFFLYGMALFYLPFFFIGQLFAALNGLPMDGFSYPYQFSLVVGAVLYTLTGLYFLRKILLRFFTEAVSALTLILVVLGTNYINHLTLKDLEPVNVLFMLMSIIVWNSIRWHDSGNPKYFRYSMLACMMMALVKPSEIMVMMIPFLWGVQSIKEFKTKILSVITDRKTLWSTIGLCFLLAMPQMTYWTLKTGFPVYDSYKNAGVGLDFFSPHILNVLFSYRKGWLLYTPIMSFALIGFYFVYRNERSIFAAITIYFLVAFYIIASWTEWWYGAAFSCRPLITSYPLLAICLGFFLTYLFKLKKVIQIAFGLVFLGMIYLNQFQWWQLRNYILDPYRTTKEYYRASFLKTRVSAEDRALLLFERPYKEGYQFTDKENYLRRDLVKQTYDHSNDKQVIRDSSGNACYHISPEIEYSNGFEYKYSALTQKDHLWIRASVDIRYAPGFPGELPCLVMCMDHQHRSYGYFAPEIKIDSSQTPWHTFTAEFLTPELRSSGDPFKCYIWNRGKRSFDVDNFRLEIFEPKK